MPYIKPEDRSKFTEILEQFPDMDDKGLIKVFIALACKYMIQTDVTSCLSFAPDLKAYPGVEDLINLLPKFNVGDFNYMLTWLSHKAVMDRGLKYANLNNLRAVFHIALKEFNEFWNHKQKKDIDGVFLCAADEFYWRICRPYENRKIKENGCVSQLEKDLNPEDPMPWEIK